MQHKSFSDMPCPVARGLERVGEWWSMMILRDAFYGLSRFDEFQKSLKIAPNMLTRRLAGLVEDGLLERKLYCEKPPRYGYHLTQSGRDFWPVLLTLVEWGSKHYSPEGKIIELRDSLSGAAVTPVLVDAATGTPITRARHQIVPGPAATAGVLQRFANHPQAPDESETDAHR